MSGAIKLMPKVKAGLFLIDVTGLVAITYFASTAVIQAALASSDSGWLWATVVILILGCVRFVIDSLGSFLDEWKSRLEVKLSSMESNT